MKSATPALLALLAGGKFISAELWTLTLFGGSVVRWSGEQVPITVNGNTWVKGPAIKRGTITEKRGLEVPTLQMTFLANDSDTINGVPLIQFIKNRGLDGALLQLD